MTRGANRRCAAAGLACLLGLCGCADATSTTPPDETGARLVKDLGPGNSNPNYFQALGRLVLFATDHDRTWRTDGTSAGTMEVSEAAPGVPTAGATRFFEGQDAEHGYELWKTDATAAGTVFVKDINPGPNRTGGGSSFPHEFTEVAGVVLFIACDGTHGWELWKTDGTDAGTAMVKDIDPRTLPGPPGSDGCNVGGWRHRDLREMNGRLYLLADDGGDGVGLWQSDGTEEGTVLVHAVPRAQPTSPRDSGWSVKLLTKAGGRLFFFGRDSLWVTDGTPAGTIALPPLPATFAAGTPSLLYGLWESGVGRSDGTAAGTYRVSSVHVPSDIRFNARLSQIATVGDHLFFLAGRETSLWTSDGTAEGTRVVEGIPAPASAASAPFSLTPFEGALYFIGEDAEHGRQLWRVDGAGPALRLTSVEGQVARAYDNWNQHVIGALGGLLLFPASGTGRTTELWGFRTR